MSAQRASRVLSSTSPCLAHQVAILEGAYNSAARHCAPILLMMRPKLFTIQPECVGQSHMHKEQGNTSSSELEESIPCFVYSKLIRTTTMSVKFGNEQEQELRSTRFLFIGLAWTRVPRKHDLFLYCSKRDVKASLIGCE
eukprot:112754-Amphidinium_carterae.1